jgi:uncharacterized protein YycO
MRNAIQQLALLPGDRVVVPKSEFRLVQHHALYIGKNHHDEDLMIENKIGIGVRVVSAEEFFRDVIDVTRIERFTGTNRDRRLAVQRALSMIGVPYHLINYNCQHFANEIQHNRVESDQVQKGVFGVVVLALLGLFLTD